MPFLTIILTLLAGLLFAVPATALQYDRVAVNSGEVSRLLTCQWTHWSTDHLLWDAIVFAVLGSVCEMHSRRGFLATILLSNLLVPLAVHAFCPQLMTFRGLSGVDSALLGLLLIRLLSAARRTGHQAVQVVAAAVIVGFVAKCFYEQFSGRTLFVDSHNAGFAVAPLSHAVGFACGAVVAMLGGSTAAAKRVGATTAARLPQVSRKHGRRPAIRRTRRTTDRRIIAVP